MNRLDLSQFLTKHIVFTQSYGRRLESTEWFVERNFPRIPHVWYKWDYSPEEPPVYMPLWLYCDKVKRDEIDALLQAQVVSGDYEGRLVGEADEYGDLVTDLETDEYVFVCLNGDED